MAIIGPNIHPYVLECIRLRSFCVSIQVPRAFVNACSEVPASCTGSHLVTLVVNIQLYVLDRICQCLFCTSSLMYWIAVDKAPPALVYSNLQLFPSSLRWFKFLLFVRSYCYPALDSDDPCPEDQEDFSAEEAIPFFLPHMG